MSNFPPDKIAAQLKRILATPEFVTRKKVSQFLRYVVAQSLNGQSGSIKQYTVAVEALGYGADFDPTTNPTVRIEARRLRRSLDQYYSTQGIEDPIRIDIPKGRYIPSFRDNQTASEAPGSSECPSPAPDRTPHSLAEPTVAVFMFENLNGKDEHSYLARGLTTELLMSLTRFSELSVLGPLDQPAGKTVDFHKIIHDYEANFVLQGCIRTHGSKIRITTDLTDASNGKKQWGRTFDYDLEKKSLFEIEDEVASQVAGVVADSLGIIFKKIYSESYPEHLKLNDVTLAVLQYNNAWATHAPQDFDRAISVVGDALEKHPKNALLVALQANLYYGDVIHEMNIVPDALLEMEGLANKAVSLDPDLQIAQYNLVPLNAFFGRVNECVEQAQKVVEMNPNHARILAGCAVHTTTAGAYELGCELIERAKQLNPHYPGWYHFVNYLAHFGNERYEEAWTAAKKIHVEGLFWHPLFRASILGKLGRTKEAKAYINELLQIKPDFPKRPKEYIKLLFAIEKHVEMIWDGLYKAGMREIV